MNMLIQPLIFANFRRVYNSKVALQLTDHTVRMLLRVDGKMKRKSLPEKSSVEQMWHRKLHHKQKLHPIVVYPLAFINLSLSLLP